MSITESKVTAMSATFGLGVGLWASLAPLPLTGIVITFAAVGWFVGWLIHINNP